MASGQASTQAPAGELEGVTLFLSVAVIPAKAGIQNQMRINYVEMDPRLREDAY